MNPSAISTRQRVQAFVEACRMSGDIEVSDSSALVDKLYTWKAGGRHRNLFEGRPTVIVTEKGYQHACDSDGRLLPDRQGVQFHTTYVDASCEGDLWRFAQQCGLQIKMLDASGSGWYLIPIGGDQPISEQADAEAPALICHPFSVFTGRLDLAA